MAPAYSAAAARFKNDPNTANVRIAKVDCTVHKELATKFDVKGFPTIKFFSSGNPVEYKGGRDEA